jgi:hypothetical protein
MTGHFHKGLYVVTSVHPLYIRTRPQSWSIGTLYRGQEFDAQAEEDEYFWGYAFGSFKGHGWVSKKVLAKKPHHDTAHSHQKPPTHLRISDYAGASTPRDAPKHRLSIHVRVARNAYLYGNYRHGKIDHSHKRFIHPIDGGKPTFVGWRYITRDGRFCMVRHERLDLWGFIKTRNITMPIQNKYHHPEPPVIGFLPPSTFFGSL